MLAIRYYRLQRGLTQQALADLVHTHQPAICSIERGHRKPGDALLGRLAAALEVSPAFTLLRPVVVLEEVTFEDAERQVPA